MNRARAFAWLATVTANRGVDDVHRSSSRGGRDPGRPRSTADPDEKYLFFLKFDGDVARVCRMDAPGLGLDGKGR